MRLYRRPIGMVVALTALAVGGASLFSAHASHVAVDDLNDTRGPLDVRRVELTGQKRPRWKVITWPRWTISDIFDKGYSVIFLDTFSGERADYFILVGSSGSGLYVELFRDRRTKRDLKIADIRRVGRGDRRSFYVRIPLGRLKIGPARTFYRWRVETLFTGERCRRVCFDLVPDAGAIVEPLPIVTPTPAPTITGSPSPTPSSS
jgi:hypothetical protein